MSEHFHHPAPDPQGSGPGHDGTARYPDGGWPPAPAPPPGTTGPGWAQPGSEHQPPPAAPPSAPLPQQFPPAPPSSESPYHYQPQAPQQSLPYPMGQPDRPMSAGPQSWPGGPALPGGPAPYGGRNDPRNYASNPSPGYTNPVGSTGFGPPGGPGGYGGPGGPGGPNGPAGYPNYWYPQPQQQPQRHPMRIAALVVSIVAIAVVVGIVVGRAVYVPTAHAALHNPFGNDPTIPVGPDAGGNGGTGGDNNGGGAGGGGNSNSQGGPSNVPAIAAKVDPGLVDINTTLGYQSARAAGTGIVLTANGIVLTNNHVINGATKISVTDLGNSQTYPAVVVGYDRTHDVAILQVTGASGLKTSVIGDSTKVTIGQQIVAIGNAGGVGGTPSTAGGTVSGLNESITASDDSDSTSEQLTGLIQVDANVQPGDSGGPLVNTAGQVVGMDTAASAPPDSPGSEGDGGGSGGGSGDSGGNQGFAIPIKQAMTIGNAIRAGTASSTVHIGGTGFLGVQPGSGNQQQSSAGAVVQAVIPNSPAEQAGLADGDVITSVNGQNVDSASTLTNLLGAFHPGDSVQVGVSNSAGPHTVTVKLADGPAA